MSLLRLIFPRRTEMYNFEPETQHDAHEFDWVEDYNTVEHILEALNA